MRPTLIATQMNNARTNSAVQSAVPLSAWGNDSSDQLGYDGSGRMITKRYLTGGIDDTTHAYTDTSSIVGFTTAFDRASNKLYERHLHAESRSHLYQPFNADGSFGVGYDSANRLRQYQRGVLSSATIPYRVNAGASVATPITLPGTDRARTYGLDGLGNWKTSNFTLVGSGGSTTDTAEVRQHNYVNEITSIRDTTGGTPATTGFAYDHGNNTDGIKGNGNLANDGVLTYQYDAFNRLIQVGDAATSAILATYVYDALGRRIQKTINNLTDGNGGITGDIPAGTTSYYYDGQQISEERDSATPTAWKQIYFWGQYIDELMFFAVPTATVYRVLSDLLYRSIAIVTTANVVTEAYDTDAYGNTLCYSGPGTDGLWFTDDDVRTNNPINSTIYTGRQYDAESQIYYYRARYYNPRTERFISRDPIGTKGGINLYGYCNNNSVIFLDGSGLVAIPTPTGNIILSGQSPLPGNFAPDSAVDYGALWLLGLAPDIVNFGPNDEATQEMMNSLIMNIDRAAMQKILQAYCQNCMAGPTQMSLGGELGKIPPAEYMPYNLGYQLFNSSWEAFVGSWTSGTISASGVDCCLCKANIHIHGINVTGFASLGHGPPVGDGSNYGKSSHLSNKTTGFGHTVTQVFDWDELLEFGPCKHC